LANGFKVLTVLIVENDENSGLLIRNFFEKIASNILRAQDGVEAVELCKQYPNIDLILMDIRMPKMNGYEALLVLSDNSILRSLLLHRLHLLLQKTRRKLLRRDVMDI